MGVADPLVEADLARGQVGIHVQRENPIHLGILEHARVDHAARAGHDLLRRLEEELEAARGSSSAGPDSTTCFATPSMTVAWQSWPQECITPGRVDL